MQVRAHQGPDCNKALELITEGTPAAKRRQFIAGRRKPPETDRPQHCSPGGRIKPQRGDIDHLAGCHCWIAQECCFADVILP